MKVTIVYDNDVYKKGVGLNADWGFSSLVEVEDTPRILFDTGTNGNKLLNNMRKLGIDPTSIDEVFVSHAHHDHTGGLSELLKVNKKAKIYVPPSFPGPSGRKVITITGPTKIHENVFSTGELDRIEQSMAVKTDKGIVLIVGCSHPRMSRILAATSKFGKIYAIIGGLHSFSMYELFRDLALICPTHCTQHKKEIKNRYPDKYVSGGVGQTITI
jgi:7,8-dihydropterin-6-yl-methyl-4-(beta-D-ribofuranosyl)aminobenzene 5'-phosphate synthase